MIDKKGFGMVSFRTLFVDNLLNKVLFQLPKQIEKVVGPLPDNPLGGYSEQPMYEFHFIYLLLKQVFV